MAKLVEFQVGEGESILVEVDDVESDEIKPASKSPGEIAAQASKTFAEAIEPLRPMISNIKQRLDMATDPADEVEVKFSVKLSAEVGAVLTKVGGEATYEITLKWQNK
jgi:hypothetical protein